MDPITCILLGYLKEGWETASWRSFYQGFHQYYPSLIFVAFAQRSAQIHGAILGSTAVELAALVSTVALNAMGGRSLVRCLAISSLPAITNLSIALFWSDDSARWNAPILLANLR